MTNDSRYGNQKGYQSGKCKQLKKGGYEDDAQSLRNRSCRKFKGVRAYIRLSAKRGRIFKMKRPGG